MSPRKVAIRTSTSRPSPWSRSRSSTACASARPTQSTPSSVAAIASVTCRRSGRAIASTKVDQHRRPPAPAPSGTGRRRCAASTSAGDAEEAGQRDRPHRRAASGTARAAPTSPRPTSASANTVAARRRRSRPRTRPTGSAITTRAAVELPAGAAGGAAGVGGRRRACPLRRRSRRPAAEPLARSEPSLARRVVGQRPLELRRGRSRATACPRSTAPSRRTARAGSSTGAARRWCG